MRWGPWSPSEALRAPMAYRPPIASDVGRTSLVNYATISRGHMSTHVIDDNDSKGSLDVRASHWELSNDTDRACTNRHCRETRKPRNGTKRNISITTTQKRNRKKKA